MSRPLAVIAPVHPLVSGVAPFNTAMLAAMRERGETLAVSWKRLYPPLVYRRDALDTTSAQATVDDAPRLLDWADPRTWRETVERIAAADARAVVMPWLHPVMAPPYRWLLAHMPRSTARVLICHNVRQHSENPTFKPLTRATLRHSDLFVTHASAQRSELADWGLGHIPVLDAFLPTFDPQTLSALPEPAAVQAERARQGNPDLSLLAFGAVRPYKGLDLGLEALARVRPEVRVKLIIAGCFWKGTAQLAARVRDLGLQDRVELCDGYQSNEQAALRFCASDCSYLPYRSASQSGVVSLAFTYRRPVIATAVGGLTESVCDGRSGILCPPENPDALARAIERMAAEKRAFLAATAASVGGRSWGRYAELIDAGLEQLRARHVPARRWQRQSSTSRLAAGKALP